MLSERAERRLPYAAAVVFDLAADFEQYPLYLPGWRAARIEWREGGRVRAEQTVGFGPVRMRLRTTAFLRRPERIEVTSDDPRFDHFNLLWTFAADGERGCRVGLGIELEPRSQLLRKALASLAPGSAEAVLEAFAQRAQGLFGPVAAQRVT